MARSFLSTPKNFRGELPAAAAATCAPSLGSPKLPSGSYGHFLCVVAAGQKRAADDDNDGALLGDAEAAVLLLLVTGVSSSSKFNQKGFLGSEFGRPQNLIDPAATTPSATDF